MATMKWDSKVAQIRGMNVKGGDLPEGFEVKLNVDLDFSNATWEVIGQYAAGGSSARVVMQTVLRGMKPNVLRDLASRTLKIHVNDIRDEDAYLSPELMGKKRQDTAVQALAGLTKRQKIEALVEAGVLNRQQADDMLAMLAE